MLCAICIKEEKPLYAVQGLMLQISAILCWMWHLYSLTTGLPKCSWTLRQMLHQLTMTRCREKQQCFHS